MQSCDPGRMTSSETLSSGGGDVIAAGMSRFFVRNGTATAAAKTRSPAAKAATVHLRIEALQEEPDRLQLERHPAREHEAGQHRRGAARQRIHDQRDGDAEQ